MMLLKGSRAYAQYETMIDLDRSSEHRSKPSPTDFGPLSMGYFCQATPRPCPRPFPRDRFKRSLVLWRDKGLSTKPGARRHGRTDDLGTEITEQAWRDWRTIFCLHALSALCLPLTGINLSAWLLWKSTYFINPPEALGPHADLPDKTSSRTSFTSTTHGTTDGGCLTFYVRSDPERHRMRVRQQSQLAVLVRSDDSWHAVSR